jgi:hypothetical protein
MHKIQESPLLFGGDAEQLRYAAPMPGRVGLGGVWYYRLKLATVEGRQKPSLILERTIPDVSALDMPEFVDAERSVLADDIKELKIAYYGVNTGANTAHISTSVTGTGTTGAAAAHTGGRDSGEGQRVAHAGRRAAEAPEAAAEVGTQPASAAPPHDHASWPSFAPPTRHRAHPRAVAYRHAHGDRQRLRVLDAQRGDRRAQHDFDGTGACRGRRCDRADGL